MDVHAVVWWLTIVGIQHPTRAEFSGRRLPGELSNRATGHPDDRSEQ